MMDGVCCAWEAAVKRKERMPIGWREWVALPQLGIAAVKAKVDTGARSSCLHAVNLWVYERRGAVRVRFDVHPYQRDTKTTVTADAEVLGYRRVKSSTGHVSVRPVIRTAMQLDDHLWEAELTLANRDTMGYRMLLGRRAVRGRFIVDPGRSYVCGKWPMEGSRKTKKKR
jgi:hypothetical protein